MESSRIGSYAMVKDVLRDVTSSQTKLSQLQNQISSGYKSSDFAGLNGSVEQFTQVESQINRVKQFNTNNQLNISKLQTADAALSKMTEIADQIKVNIIGANGATIHTSNLKQIVTDLLTTFGGELNASFGGSYIFGGVDTANPPVPTTNTSNLVLGVPDDNYYAGAKADAILRADDRTDILFPVRADDPAFQKIFAAAKLAISAATSNDTGTMAQAQQLIQEGQKELSAARSKVGSTVNNIQAVDDRLKSLTVYWKEFSDGISKTDIVAASTEVASYQAILQATFQIYARLSQLRLSDYLK